MDQPVPFPMQRGYGFGQVHHGGGHPLDWVILALLLLLIALVVAQFATSLGRRRHRGPMWRMRHEGPGPWGTPGPPDPLAFARMRYARGEIDRETYLQLTQDLGGEPSAAPPPAPA
ncbi:MAG TPA: hypothetical protein VMU58_06000 [Gaiellaceae bacterium]|nr:hypothetical protein [Gaiellaceae bacterium]